MFEKIKKIFRQEEVTSFPSGGLLVVNDPAKRNLQSITPVNAGVVTEFATEAEVLAGTVTDKAIAPATKDGGVKFLEFNFSLSSSAINVSQSDNTTGQIPTYSRTSTGTFDVDFPSSIIPADETKLSVFTTYKTGNNTIGFIVWARISDTKFQFQCYSVAEALTDDVSGSVMIKIKP